MHTPKPRHITHEKEHVDALVETLGSAVDECCQVTYSLGEYALCSFPTRDIIRIEEAMVRLQVAIDLLVKARPYVTR